MAVQEIGRDKGGRVRAGDYIFLIYLYILVNGKERKIINWEWFFFVYTE